VDTKEDFKSTRVWANPTFQAASAQLPPSIFLTPVLLFGLDNACLMQVHREFAGGDDCRGKGYRTSSAPPALLSHNRRPAMHEE